jgi:tyrosine-protein kinase Etk/Wzc
MENQYNENNQMQEQEINLSDYITILLRYKYLILIIFVVVVGLAIIYTARAPRIYQASSKIMLEDRAPANLLFAPVGQKASSINNTIEILKSRPVLQTAYQIMQREPRFADFPINPRHYDSEDNFSPIGYFDSRMNVESKRETDILTISFESTSPQESQAAANAAASALMQQDTDYARMEFRNTREFLEEQLDQVERRLRAAEEELRNFKIDHGISMLSEETKKLIDQSSELGLLLSTAETDLEVADDHLNFLQSQLTQQNIILEDVNSILTSPLLEQLRTEILTLQKTYVTYLTRQDYTPDHPELVRIDRQIENVKTRLNDEIQRLTQSTSGSSDPLHYRAELVSKISTAKIEKNLAEAKVRSIQDVVTNYNQRLATIPDTEVQLARLEREYAITEKTYSMLIEKYEDAKIVEQSKIGQIRFIEEAAVPGSPIKPNRRMNYLLAIVIGGGLGIGASLMINSLDKKIRTFDDVKHSVALPILGTIPFINIFYADLEKVEKVMKETTDPKELKKLEHIRNQIDKKLITNYAPKSAASESFRTFRTNVISKRKNDEAMTILVTSSGPGEGKTTTITNLAVTLAQMEAKVLQIDLDLRRPLVHTFFNLEKENGISDFLMDKSKDIESIISPTQISNLDTITSGLIPPNPSELLASKRLDEALKILKQKYDYILLDSPPVIAVTDSLVLANKVDIIALVVRVGKADVNIIKRAKELMANVGVDITGAVINGVHPQKYYSAYEYNYYYYYYYETEKGKRAKKGGGNSYITESILQNKFIS